MTYCCAIKLDHGLAFMSDTRTNAGMDSISVFSKMTTWHLPGERTITVLTAGNLASTQAAIGLLDERAKAPAEREPSLLAAPSMFQVARIVGETLREAIGSARPIGETAESSFNASIILGGQIGDSPPRLFLIYPEGNFIEASDDTPFFQIGETKYGKPILVRAYEPNMSFEDAVKLLLVSFDSTIKSNLSVGLPLDLFYYKSDSLEAGYRQRIDIDDPYYQLISSTWSDELKEAFNALPNYQIKQPASD